MCISGRYKRFTAVSEVIRRSFGVFQSIQCHFNGIDFANICFGAFARHFLDYLSLCLENLCAYSALRWSRKT